MNKEHFYQQFGSLSMVSIETEEYSFKMDVQGVVFFPTDKQRVITEYNTELV